LEFFLLQALVELACNTMSSGRGLIGRRRGGNTWLRTGLIIFIIIFISLQINFLSYRGSSDPNSELNDSNAAILSMVPAVLHKFLTPRPRNMTNSSSLNGTAGANTAYNKWTLNISDIKRNIAQYNLQQTVYNEDIFGPLQNDSVVIVIQVPTYIVSLFETAASSWENHFDSVQLQSLNSESNLMKPKTGSVCSRKH
jgi:hypothetical protein